MGQEKVWRRTKGEKNVSVFSPPLLSCSSTSSHLPARKRDREETIETGARLRSSHHHPFPLLLISSP